MEPVTKSILSHALQIAKEAQAKAILVYADVFSDPHELMTFAADRALILVSSKEMEKLEGTSFLTLRTPAIRMTRISQIKISLLLALIKELINSGDQVVCVSGVAASDILDTAMVVEVSRKPGLLVSPEGGPFAHSVKPEVFERVIQLAVQLAAEGREGKRVGGLFVLGDCDNVAKYCSQMIINPFQGYPENERNILDEQLEETVKEFSLLDGAFVIREDGTILSAGTYLRPGKRGEKLPRGLGARHQAAASITASTAAMAVTISQSSSTVTIFGGGKIIMDIEKPREVAEEPAAGMRA